MLQCTKSYVFTQFFLGILSAEKTNESEAEINRCAHCLAGNDIAVYDYFAVFDDIGTALAELFPETGIACGSLALK